jgi:hypothetical protein
VNNDQEPLKLLRRIRYKVRCKMHGHQRGAEPMANTAQVLKVTRELIPIEPSRDDWATPFEFFLPLGRRDQTVWLRTVNGDIVTNYAKPPDGYVAGILTPYIDDKQVDLITFNAALASVGIIREDIEDYIMAVMAAPR